MKRSRLKRPLVPDRATPSPSAPTAKHVKLKASAKHKQVQAERLAQSQQKAEEGRDHLGRFAKNNHYSKGNPFAKQVQILRTAIYNSIDPFDVHAIVRALVKSAKRGNPVAAKLLLDRSLGRINDVERALAEMVEADEQIDFVGNEKHV